MLDKSSETVHSLKSHCSMFVKAKQSSCHWCLNKQVICKHDDIYIFWLFSLFSPNMTFLCLCPLMMPTVVKCRRNEQSAWKKWLFGGSSAHSGLLPSVSSLPCGNCDNAEFKPHEYSQTSICLCIFIQILTFINFCNSWIWSEASLKNMKMKAWMTHNQWQF